MTPNTIASMYTSSSISALRAMHAEGHRLGFDVLTQERISKDAFNGMSIVAKQKDLAPSIVVVLIVSLDDRLVAALALNLVSLLDVAGVTGRKKPKAVGLCRP